MFSRILPLIMATTVLARDLVPIPPPSQGAEKRDSTSSNLDLKSLETFLWADPSNSSISAALANLTVYMPGSSENILSMESFSGMLTNVECSSSSLNLTFKDNTTFATAQRVWDWVNGADNHSFVMVTGPAQCGSNTTDRQPYVVSKLNFDEAHNRANLCAQPNDWTTVAHSFDLHVGLIPGSSAPNTPPQARGLLDDFGIDESKSLNIPFAHSFPGSLELNKDALSAKLTCTDCSTSGSFNTDFHLKQTLGSDDIASMTLKPKDVKADAKLELTGSGTLKDSVNKELQFLSVPIDALNIPGVLKFGPFLTFSLGAEISDVTLTAGLNVSAGASLSNDAVLTVDLLNPSNNHFSGWDPEVGDVDIKADGSLAADVSVYLKPELELDASALGKGFKIGLDMQVPKVGSKLSVIDSNKGACPAPARTTKEGVGATLSIGGSLNIEARLEDKDDPLFTTTIAQLEKPLGNKCFPFGDELKNVTARAIGSPSVAAAAFVREMAAL